MASSVALLTPADRARIPLTRALGVVALIGSPMMLVVRPGLNTSRRPGYT